MKEKTYVEDVDRNMYDFRNEEKDAYRIRSGLTEDIVEKISEEKHDPEWMHDFRLNSLKVYNEMKVPDWGPSIEGLNMDKGTGPRSRRRSRIPLKSSGSRRRSAPLSQA